MTEDDNIFYHRGSLGDIIYSLPTIIAHDVEAVLYLRDRIHIAFHKELLKTQSYIKDVRWVMDGKKYGFIWAKTPFVNLCHFEDIAWRKRNQHLVLSHLETPNKKYDLSKIWLHSIEPKHVADVIIQRSLNYHDKEEIDWKLLNPIKDRCKVIGFEGEQSRLKRHFGVDIEFYKVENALELARIIKGSKLFVGNQSIGFALAEAMKHPRVLEVCYAFNNCQPHGKDGYTYLKTKLIDRYLNKGNDNERN